MEEKYRVTSVDGTETYTGFKGFAKGDALELWKHLNRSEKKDVAQGNRRITITQVDENNEEIIGGYSADIYDILVEDRRYDSLTQYFEYRFFCDIIDRRHGMNSRDEMFADLEAKGYLRAYADNYKEVGEWLKHHDGRVYNVEIPLQGYYMVEVEADSVEDAISKAYESMNTSSMDEFVEVNDTGLIWVNGMAIE